MIYGGAAYASVEFSGEEIGKKTGLFRYHDLNGIEGQANFNWNPLE